MIFGPLIGQLISRAADIYFRRYIGRFLLTQLKRYLPSEVAKTITAILGVQATAFVTVQATRLLQTLGRRFKITDELLIRAASIGMASPLGVTAEYFLDVKQSPFPNVLIASDDLGAGTISAESGALLSAMAERAGIPIVVTGGELAHDPARPSHTRRGVFDVRRRGLNELAFISLKAQIDIVSSASFVDPVHPSTTGPHVHFTIRRELLDAIRSPAQSSAIARDG